MAFMRAVVLTGHGGLDKLQYREDLPVPIPSAGEVLVAVAACGVNNTDINTRTGWYAPTIRTGITEEFARNGPSEGEDSASWDRKSLGFPRIQGAAIAGTIAAVGDGIDTMRIGERVVVDPVVRDMTLRRWARGVDYIGSERNGGFAEYAAVPAENALRIDSDLPAAALAALPCAYQTAEEMQIRSRLSAGETVLVTGASGGVGSANVLLAKLRGARVIAVAGADKEAKVRALGADMFIPRGARDLAEAVHAQVGERGVDVVLDVTGGSDVLAMWRVLDRAGRYATGGAIAGPISEVDLRDIIYKDLEMFGIANPEPEAMHNLIAYAEAGKLVPPVDAIFPLHELVTAQEKFASKKHVGKIIISVER